MKHLTLNIIVDALFGVDLSTEDWDLEPAFKRILTHFERISQTYLYLPEWIPTPENGAYRSAISTLDSAVEDLIAAHRAGDIDGPTVLNYLLESDEGWDTKDLRDEIVTLLLAGHETTALMLTFTGDLLVRHPEVQETVAREVREKPFSYFFGYNNEYSELDGSVEILLDRHEHVPNSVLRITARSLRPAQIPHRNNTEMRRVAPVELEPMTEELEVE
ncbi:cytochrome P450 [Haloferax sp. S2CR25-2]|nr:cytochrome P450 [Haloferax sp. S2CR25]MDS0446356.1 cytochrome P450 [Haloferax sp. S2CR25-2]